MLTGFFVTVIDEEVTHSKVTNNETLYKDASHLKNFQRF